MFSEEVKMLNYCHIESKAIWIPVIVWNQARRGPSQEVCRISQQLAVILAPGHENVSSGSIAYIIIGPILQVCGTAGSKFLIGQVLVLVAMNADMACNIQHIYCQLNLV